MDTGGKSLHAGGVEIGDLTQEQPDCGFSYPPRSDSPDFFFTARSISLPIGKLTGAVKGITTENLDIEIDPGVERSNDEIGQLARAFKDMASSLNLALDKIK